MCPSNWDQTISPAWINEFRDDVEFTIGTWFKIKPKGTRLPVIIYVYGLDTPFASAYNFHQS